ncbi:transglycosylase SLT domain-containing protein [Comamonas aquatica]|uniref:transglycosylase SLT domain-containing protein n=1 Tax=Comamonas aquatica TaxID=225991 RepID=UPI00244882E4|nr:transglycosylase SLT domain-containing protein [Comamonas aquatica]MDH1766618.1 transglycosylase SLT domain-containing protein [Comamonas aquatica]
MNLRHLLVLASVVWLAGCATAPSTSSYDGPLKPITRASPGTSKVTSLEYNSDLWERIRRGFAMPDLEHELVGSQEQWYSSRPDYIERMTTRSSKYLFHIVEELEQRNMPMELALLPYIESAFNPQAVSSAKAAGMWQFMPATGSYFELTQNAFRDDRRDVLASTRAALDYLEKLHRMFGDWHLALAAYNWGEGSVGRAIKRNERMGLETSYTDLNMPGETRNYVPKLQAVKNIIAHPEKFNIELPNIENHPYFQAVEIKRDMDIELVARLADVRLEDFKALNPSFSRPTIFAAGTTQILLPWDNAKVFQRNLAAYDDDQYASWTVWVAPSTMTVASAAQRVGMSETDLRSVNRIPPRMMIKAGSALMVPRSPQHRQDVSTHIADHGTLAFAPEITEVTRRTAVKVLRGDNMAKVASRHGVTVANLARWNDMKPTASLRAGQSLEVYKTVRVSAAPTRTAQVSKSAKASNTSKRPRATGTAKEKPVVTKVAQQTRGDTPTKRKR